MNALAFTFVAAAARVKFMLVRMSTGAVIMSNLETSIDYELTPDEQAKRLEWVHDTMLRVILTSAPVPSDPIFPANDQTYAHLLAWSAIDTNRFLKLSAQLKYDREELLAFAREHKCDHINKAFEPRTHTLVMRKLTRSEYKIDVVLTKAGDNVTATYSVQGMLTPSDIEHVTTAINIMKDTVDGCNTSQRIEGLRRATKFDESVFVHIAMLTKNQYLSEIKACVKLVPYAQTISTMPWH